MAKGSAMGLWKGKKGSSVFYQIKNSNSLQKQGVRERNYEPSNPQTANQAGQRMRMYPAQAVYGAIKSVIERSWQGIKYGQMSRQAYLKRALRVDPFPAIEKGSGVVVPAPYQIAKGTLPEVAPTVSAGDFTFPLYAPTNQSVTDQVSEISEQLLSFNSWLQSGDQITFVFCHTDLQGFGFYWHTCSFYIDESNTSSLLESPGFEFFTDHPDEFEWREEKLVLGSSAYTFLAAACIISREGDSQPLRSNATLAVDYFGGEMQAYFSAEAINKAKRSYMKQVSALSLDWPADPSDGEGGDGTIAINATSLNTQMGTVTGGGRYLPGELVALTATANPNYQFIGWYATQADAEAGENRLSGAGIITFAAGDSSAFGGTTTFWAKFMLEE